jgi:hypothetical protein
MRLLTVFFLGFLLLLPAVAAAQDNSHLKIEITPLHAAVKNTDTLSINTKISNIGPDDRRLQVWSCSYPEMWRSDSPAVTVEQVSCKKNGLQNVTLKPGEAYARELSVRVSVKALELAPESVTFRLGFAPSFLLKGPPVIWSKAVTVGLTE